MSASTGSSASADLVRVRPLGALASWRRRMVEELRVARDGLREVWRARGVPRHPAVDVGRLEQALAVLDAGEPDDDCEEPVFLLATGWRTGSTLLQRVLVTDARLLMWGEPLGRMALLPRMVEMLSAADRQWPTAESSSLPGTREELETAWIANLHPGGPDLRRGLRALLDAWLAAPARGRGFARWGLKEVRFGAAEARVLRWIYPRARFVVLLRHPYSAYRSARNWRLYARWPDRTVDCAVAFARHWNALATSWTSTPASVRPIIVRYEDMLSGECDLAWLGQQLNLHLAPERAIAARVGVKRTKRELSRCERRLVVREAADGMTAFGYLPDGTVEPLRGASECRD